MRLALFVFISLFFFNPITPVQAAKKQIKVIDEPQEVELFEGSPKIRVKMRHGRIKTIDLETYLAGVIGNEMSRRWPVEALRAQSVAARSYALKRMAKARKYGRSYDIVTTQADQVFRLRDIQNNKLKQIVESTRGQVLWHDHDVVEAFYSSTCGGKGRSPVEAGLSRVSPFDVFKKDDHCKISPHYRWQFAASLKTIKDRLKKRGLNLNDIERLRVKRDKKGYVKNILIKDNKKTYSLKAKDFRRAMGWMNVKSYAFDMKKKKNVIKVTGKGFGHGVGMCQFGAKAMAASGKSYEDILAFYYPKVDLVKAYP